MATTPHLEQLSPFEVDLRSVGEAIARLGAAGLFFGVVTINAPLALGAAAVGFAGHYTSSSIERAAASRSEA